MENQIIYSVASYLLFLFWVGIYLFSDSSLAVGMASIFGAFTAYSLGLVCRMLFQQWNAVDSSRISDFINRIIASIAYGLVRD